jgi:hypothetical protein
MLRMMRCVEDGGVEIIDGPSWDEETGTKIEFSMSGGATHDSVEEKRTVYNRCYEQYSAAIEWMWTVQNSPSEETLSAARAALGECLREAGVAEVPGQPTSAQLGAYADREEYWLCSEQVGAEFGVSNFAG